MNLFPNSSLFLGFSATSGIRRVIREPWEGSQETELSDVPREAASFNEHPSGQTSAVSAATLFSTKAAASSTPCLLSGSAASPSESSSAVRVGSPSLERWRAATALSPSTAEHCEELYIGETLRVSRTRSAASLKGTSSGRLTSRVDKEEGSSSIVTKVGAFSPQQTEGTGDSGFRAQSYDASGEAPLAEDALSNTEKRKASPLSPHSVASPRSRLSRGISQTQATPPCEKLLYQRQQQRKLQQQGALVSLATLSSCSSAEDLGERLGARRLRLVRTRFSGDDMSPPAAALQDGHDPQQQNMGGGASDNGGGFISEQPQGADLSTDPSCEATGPPVLSTSLRLQLLQEVMCSNNPSSSSRSEKKWWSMDDRNLEAFIFAHHQTFIRRLKRGVPPAYRWRAWQAVCAYQRAERRQALARRSPRSPGGLWALHPSREGSPSPAYRIPSPPRGQQQHALPEGFDSAEFLEAYEGGEVSPTVYEALARHKSPYYGLIQIDVPRTFPELAVVDKHVQGMLCRILNAFANLHPEVGYCQGMNFIGGLLLLVSAFDELGSFSFFCFMMVHHHLKEFFRERFPLLRRYIKAFDRLSVIHLPQLREHFLEEGVLAPVYLHQWFLTTFITSLPLRSVLVVWDFVLADGLHALLQLAVALLNVLTRFLLRLKFEDIVKFLKSLKCSGRCDDYRIGKMLVKQAAKIHVPSDIMEEVSPSDIDALIREAEKEEEDECRSRSSMFRAASSINTSAPKDSHNPLALFAVTADDDDDGDGGDATNRTPPSKPILAQESEAELGFESSPEFHDRCGSEPDSNQLLLPPGGPGNNSAGDKQVQVDHRAYLSQLENWWQTKEPQSEQRNSSSDLRVDSNSTSRAASFEDGGGFQGTSHHESRDVSQEVDSGDNDGYEMLEMSASERGEARLMMMRQHARTGGSSVRSSSTLISDGEALMEMVTRLWLTGR